VGLTGPRFACCHDEPTTKFAYTRPEDHRDPVSPDDRFLRACGVLPTDVRDELRMLDRRPKGIPAVES
jgi:hypothetical protein